MSEKFARRYRLESYLKLQSGADAGFIYSSYPLFATRTSPTVIEVLRRCDGQNSVQEVARQLKLKPASVLKVLDELHQKGLVQLLLPLPPPDEALPSVSLVIPVYNRPTEIKRCLEALFKLDYPADKLEIIIVDDASTDTTPQIIANYPVKLLQNPVQLGPAGSRNRAIASACHGLIACVDSDCVVSPDWLRQLVPLFADEKLAVAGGATRAFAPRTLLQRYEDSRSSLFMGQRPSEVQLGKLLSYLPTCNLVLRREAFVQIGGFEPGLRFGEDVDLCWRLLKANWKIRYNPSAQLGHDYRASLPGFLKTRFDYATSEAALLTRHPEQRRTLFIPLKLLATYAQLNIKYQVSSNKEKYEVGSRKSETNSQLATFLPTTDKRQPITFKKLLLPTFYFLLPPFQKWWKLRGYGLPLKLWQVLLAEGRSYGAAGYHFGVHLGKYYSWPLLIGLAFRQTRWKIALILLGPQILDYFRLQPKMNLPTFAGLGLLENFSYQLGLIAGCTRQKDYQALLPKVRVWHLPGNLK